MKEIKATNSDKIIFVDDEDYEKANSMTWAVTNEGYARRNVWLGKVDGKRKYAKLYLHRFLTDAAKGLDVDHINHNRLDNRRSNLRVVSRVINLLNKTISPNHKSGVHGVKQNKSGTWTASISIYNKPKHLGTFKTKEEAVERRKQFEKEKYGADSLV